jgi:hydrogenase maturation factor
MGKLSNRNLKKLLSYIKKDSRVIVPPLPGFDSGVHLIGDKYLVVSTDPCINVPEEWFGWLLIHYASSDVALFGAKPEYCTINLLGPLSTKPETFYRTMKQACEAADELKIAIVTGHTGTYKGLSTLIGVCTAYGTVDKERLITPDGAKPDDYILCTKPIGLEIAVNFALTQSTLAEKLFGVQRTQELADLVNVQSCVKEALLLAKIDGVHAMHDATEGGLTAALNEMAKASKAGFKIESEKVQVPNEVYTLQKHFKFSDEQLMAMSSTGTILAAVSPEARGNVEESLRRNGVEAKFLGFFTKSNRCLLVKNGQETLFPRKANDPYERILSVKL